MSSEADPGRVRGTEANERPFSSQPRPAAGAGLPRLILWKADVCAMLGVKLRTLERMVSAREIPPPDRRLRGRPAWLASTIHEWVASGCRSVRPDSPLTDAAA